MKQQVIIVWLRDDLRMTDNPALLYAAQQGIVIPVYIDDSSQIDHCKAGAASNYWLHHSLDQLNRSMTDGLGLFKGDPLTVLQHIAEITGARLICWNRRYTPDAIHRDSAIEAQLLSHNIEVKTFNGSLLWEPWTIAKADGSPYKVFTAFYNNGCLKASEPALPMPAPASIQLYRGPRPDQQRTLQQLRLLPEHHWPDKISEHWDISEKAAQAQLSRFISERLQDYETGRDFPSQQLTSGLSPYLKHGQISPNQVWHSVRQEACLHHPQRNQQKFLQQLGWREFAYYQLYHQPQMPDQNLKRIYDHFPWQHDAGQIRLWQQGKTGFPIIDAGMRELWQTGSMHNRVRMLSASFLVKNQLQHWLHGARWFYDTLVDADLAINSASWQWVAGAGADAAPYFRIFNPVLQGQKFDPGGDYIRHYIPELSLLPDHYIHRPWEASDNILQAANIRLGTTYPNPILDLKTSRSRALEALQQMKQQAEIFDQPR